MNVFKMFDGFLFADVTNKAEKLAGVLDLYTIDDNGAESFLDTPERVTEAIQTGQKIYIDICHEVEILEFNEHE